MASRAGGAAAGPAAPRALLLPWAPALSPGMGTTTAMRCPGLLLACCCWLPLLLPHGGAAVGVAVLTGDLEASWGGRGAGRAAACVLRSRADASRAGGSCAAHQRSCSSPTVAKAGSASGHAQRGDLERDCDRGALPLDAAGGLRATQRLGRAEGGALLASEAGRTLQQDGSILPPGYQLFAGLQC